MKMWKRTESDDVQPDPPFAVPSEPTQPIARARELATIGPSISIRGELLGEEDLIVQGRVEGVIDLRQNNVTIGKDGRIKADIKARVIKVDGHVEGNLRSEEQVIIRRSGNVTGDIVTPRVTLEDGCRFRGAIDMEVKSQDKQALITHGAAGIKPVAAAPAKEVGREVDKETISSKAETQAAGKK
jgi:cytoskeletal protein CcmA (bactofilin family)